MSSLRPLSRLAAAIAGLALLAPLFAQTAQEGPVQRRPRTSALERQINRAIGRGLGYLTKTNVEGLQRRKTRGAGDRADGLALYAALHSGARPKDATIARALFNFAQRRQSRTYETALALMALELGDSERYAKKIQKLASRLVETQSSGTWGYPGGDDLSNTQYAVLGLHAAERAGANVPTRAWTRLAKGLEAFRADDGGFCYSRGGEVANLSMTAAGVACAVIAIKALTSEERAPHDYAVRDLNQLVDAGLTWINQAYASPSPGKDGMDPMNLYALYGIERVGGLTGREELGSRKWYREGAMRLLRHQRADGSWDGAWGTAASTSFALLFLSRATSGARQAPISGPTSTGQGKRY